MKSSSERRVRGGGFMAFLSNWWVIYELKSWLTFWKIEGIGGWACAVALYTETEGFHEEKSKQLVLPINPRSSCHRTTLESPPTKCTFVVTIIAVLLLSFGRWLLMATRIIGDIWKTRPLTFIFYGIVQRVLLNFECRIPEIDLHIL